MVYPALPTGLPNGTVRARFSQENQAMQKSDLPVRAVGVVVQADRVDFKAVWGNPIATRNANRRDPAAFRGDTPLIGPRTRMRNRATAKRLGLT